ncbi:MAG: hypothetical protein KatS3mg034_2061 [Vicingaceae bacterium]|nr:MAG: hypothetical protein KatS3mg034_2061 [Vicingaceae bacterium]
MVGLKGELGMAAGRYPPRRREISTLMSRFCHCPSLTAAGLSVYPAAMKPGRQANRQPTAGGSPVGLPAVWLKGEE